MERRTQSPVAIPYSITFIIPNPPRLTTLNEAEYDSALKTVRISLEGVDLSGTHKVTLSVNGTETVTIDVVFSSSQGQLGGILFDSETPTNVNMAFNTRYEIVEMKKDDVKVLCLGALSFTTKTEPTRLVTLECGYDEAKKTALIRMTGRALDSTKEYEIELRDSGNSKKTIEMSFNPTLCEWEGSAILYSVSETVELEYGMTYSVRGFMTKGETSPHLHEELTITIDDEPSRFNVVSITPNSIHTSLRLQLSGNGFIGKYLVTLTSDFSFVTAESATSAVSEEIALGWSDSLAFDAPFTIQSIVSMNPDSVVLLNGTLSFTTPKKQDSLSLFVDGGTGETSRWLEIIAELGVRRPTIGIVDSATLGSPIRVENGMVALLSNFGNVEPTLRIPSSACAQVESGMIVVSSSTLEIRDVDIVIDSLSFVRSPFCNELELDTEGRFIFIANLSFGAVNMRNGSLEVVTSSFHANSPNLSSFPSLRRNIRCSDGGHIEIGSLNGGMALCFPFGQAEHNWARLPVF
ncbi:hypothetical protein BLNAU_3818 [Blattamonas nauphoetae]|uniref:Uncharacterized protein n=1 Tax=Blattamonas nauphoetae TaxID=2049346 RepID=A0ABQ9YBF5_9EUKA|nr:hypothetical protein BLNAU_3818 [Blattamonas nauphoetae]